MGSPVVRFGLIPGIVLAALSALRAWMDLNHPAEAKWLSVFLLSAVWLLWMSVTLLRRGAAFITMLKSAAVFSVVVRGAIAVNYALAWTRHWKTSSGDDVRYVKEVREFAASGMEIPVDASFWRVWAYTALFPMVIHTAFACLVWFVAWSIAFRDKRPAVRAAATTTA
jgi:hypothetical protein